MTTMNPVAAGGPVGGGMMMNSGSPAAPVNMGHSDGVKTSLNTYIYEYFLKLGHFDIARALVKEEKFEIRAGPSKQSPGRRRDNEVNGETGDAMDMDLKDDIPDDLPRPFQYENGQGNGFLFEWFSIFSDLFAAHRNQGKINGSNITPATQYLLQHQQMQRLRETQQSRNLQPGAGLNTAMMQNMRMRNGMMNGAMAGGKLTPQQMQQMQQQMQNQQKAHMMQQQMQRGEQPDGDMNGRPGTPAEGDNGGSPSKRPRLEGQQQFNNGMMPNGRPGVPGPGPQGMMIQSGFQPGMNQAQFRQNGGMPQKAMQPGMPNGMMNMGNAGSPMMQNMSQFPEGMQMDTFQQGRMPNQAMQGAPAPQSGNHALQDYQMQLMLLEQQNKKRLMMARQEQHENNPRDGGPMPGVNMPPGLSPSGSRTGTSPNPADQMKRNAQLGGLPGSPSAADAMQRGSPAAMGFMNGMNGMQPQDFNAMFMKNDQQMMVPGGPAGMRPPTSVDMNAMARQQQQQQQQQGRPNQFQGGQPMAQQQSQGGQQPMGTPVPRNEMPPPQAPAGGNSAQRNQPSSPANSNAPPTPSQTSKPNPKSKKGKDEPNKKRPVKKNSTANAPASDDNPAATPNPSTPVNSSNGPNFNTSGGKGQAPGMQANQQTPQNSAIPQNQPQMPQQDLGQAPGYNDFTAQDGGFNLDFSTLENADVLENFDFDSFLNTSADDAFNFDAGMGVDTTLNFDHAGE